MTDDWTARGALGGLDVEIRRGRSDGGEYLVVALKGAPDLDGALARATPPHLAPWLALWQPWLALWQAAWAPVLALAAQPSSQPRGPEPPRAPRP